VGVEHTSRTGKTYYLHKKQTRTGRTTWFFSQKSDGELADAIPDGYEVYESVNGQVFLRKKVAQEILPAELALVETALGRHREAWQHRVEVKKNAITIYEAGEPEHLDQLSREFLGRPATAEERLKGAYYMAVLRFILIGKTTREFVTERFCFRGSVDDWIHIGGPGTLTEQVGKYMQHLGRESMYELF
jgi:hypothetical protein